MPGDDEFSTSAPRNGSSISNGKFGNISTQVGKFKKGICGCFQEGKDGCFILFLCFGEVSVSLFRN